ncbi:MAG: hypothetical protein ACOYL1_04260 [Chlamydiia bacterium]
MIQFYLSLSLLVNPFEVDFFPKSELTYEDYEEVQTALREKNIEPLVEEWFPNDWGSQGVFTKRKPYSKGDFVLRCSKGLKQQMINRTLGYYPIKELLKGDGSMDKCVVLGCSMDRNYQQNLHLLIEALREIGYDGAIYYRVGGYPNPTGDEIRYAGVPYAFKLFLVQEALMLGYEKVLWLDTAAWPMENLDPIFKMIELDGFFFDRGKPNPLAMLPRVRQFLEEYCGKNLALERRVAGWIMGFSLRDPRVELFFKEYKKMVRLGFPFLSVNPEEGVITSILLKCGISVRDHKNLMFACTDNNLGYVKAKRERLKFLVRTH